MQCRYASCGRRTACGVGQLTESFCGKKKEAREKSKIVRSMLIGLRRVSPGRSRSNVSFRHDVAAPATAIKRGAHSLCSKDNDAINAVMGMVMQLKQPEVMLNELPLPNGLLLLD